MAAIRSGLFSMSVLMILLSAPLVDVALGATIEEVTAALTAAKQADDELRVAANTWISYLNTTPGLDISGNITILLSKNFLFMRYNFSSLTSAQTRDVLHLHILNGLLSFEDIKSSPSSTHFETKNTNETLQRIHSPGGNVQMRVAKAVQGPRRNSEVQAPIPRPDIHLGSTVYVHGFASKLTPSGFAGGPFQTVNV